MRDKLDVARESSIMFIGAILLILSILGIALLIAWPITSYRCKADGQTTGLTTEYKNVIAGCYIKVNGHFIPEDNWRGVSK